MIFIVGGAHQGKSGYAEKNYGLKPEAIMDGSIVDFEAAFKAGGIKNFHLLIKRLIYNGASPLEYVRKILSENENIIIIMDEIGSGIVPIEKSERLWREQTGITGCFIAECAERVERVVCGIGVRIK